MPGESALLRAIATQVDWWWAVVFRRRLEDLTDDEFWWEPAPDCWSLHPRADGSYAYEWPPGSRGESTPPFTTIAWRLCHLALPAMASWAMGMEGDRDCQSKAADLTFPGTAAAAVETVDSWWDRWRAALRALDDNDLWRRLGDTSMGVDAPAMRLGAEDPFLNHLLHQHREFIHHGAEVSLLRDLYRARGGQR